MNRREFSAATACAGVPRLLGCPPAAVRPGARRPRKEPNYLTPRPTVPVDAPPGKVEVIEFFWYDCPHCNAFEPRLEAWPKKLPPDVVFNRVPGGFRDDFVPQQRLYYALEAMGKVDDLHAKVFYAIHVNHEPPQPRRPHPGLRAEERPGSAPSSWSCTTRSRSPARHAGPAAAGRLQGARACRRWVLPGASTLNGSHRQRHGPRRRRWRQRAMLRRRQRLIAKMPRRLIRGNC